MADRNRCFMLAAIALPFLLLTMSGSARAATITVDTVGDPGLTGTCDLRDAITNANDQNQSGSTNCAAGTGTDNIQFSVTGTIGIGSTGTLPAIVSGETLTIQGPTTLPGITIDGGDSVRLMQVSSGASLTLQFLTLANGNAHTGSGGGIANSGTLTVTNSTFSGNRTFGGNGGGGIINEGALTVTNSTFSGNHTEGNGGAIENLNGTLTVTNSTFSGDSAPVGSSINNESGPGSATLKGTILATTSNGNCGGSINDGGYNISNDPSCNFGATGSHNKVTTIDLASGLADNGGPTETVALLAGSSAIDAIPLVDCPATDQRGVARPDAGENVCDIGAYESAESFAGQTGTANCQGSSVSALSNQYGTLDAAASALGFPSVKALRTAIRQFCRG